MKIDYERLILSNFRSWGTLDLEFSKLKSPVAMVGLNGAGKSSLALGVPWTLYGRCPRFIKGASSITRISRSARADKVSGDIYFKQDERHFRVQRSFKLERGLRQGWSQAVRVYEMGANEEWIDLGLSGVEEAQAWIDRAVGDYETFYASSFITHGDGGFLNATREEREKVLIRMVGLSSFEGHFSSAGELRLAHQRGLDVLQKQKAALEDKLSSGTRRHTELTLQKEAALRCISAAPQDSASVLINIEKLVSEKTALSQEIAESTKHLEQIDPLRAKISALRASLTDTALENEEAFKRAVLAGPAADAETLIVKKTVSDLSGPNSLDTERINCERERLEIKKKAALAKLSDLDKLESRKKLLEEALSQLTPPDPQALEKAMFREKNLALICDLLTRHPEHTAFWANGKILTEIGQRLKDISADCCSGGHCEPVKRLVAFCDDTCRAAGSGPLPALISSGADTSFVSDLMGTSNGVLTGMLAEARRTLASMESAVRESGRLKTEISGISENLKGRDIHAEDLLRSDEALQNISKLLLASVETSKSIASLTRKIGDLSSISMEAIKAKSSLERISLLKEKRTSIEKEVIEAEAQLAALSQKAANISGLKIRLTAAERGISEKKVLLAGLATEKQMSASLDGALREIQESVEALTHEHTALLQHLDAASRKFYAMKIIETFFSANGFRKKAVGRSLKQLSGHVTSALTLIWPGTEVALEENYRGRQPSIEVSVKTPAGVLVEYAGLSAGQQFIVSLSFLLGIRRLFSDKGASGSGMLVIDEGLGYLDESMVQAARAAISLTAKATGAMIFVMSHVPAAWSLGGSRLVIRQDEAGISRYEIDQAGRTRVRIKEKVVYPNEHSYSVVRRARALAAVDAEGPLSVARANEFLAADYIAGCSRDKEAFAAQSIQHDQTEAVQ